MITSSRNAVGDFIRSTTFRLN